MLTDAAIRRLKSRGKSFKISDMHGLCLLAHPNGGRYRRPDYVHASKRGTLALGVYPAVSLKEARESVPTRQSLSRRASTLPPMEN